VIDLGEMLRQDWRGLPADGRRNNPLQFDAESQLRVNGGQISETLARERFEYDDAECIYVTGRRVVARETLRGHVTQRAGQERRGG
jgi:hypothetical protein